MTITSDRTKLRAADDEPQASSSQEQPRLSFPGSSLEEKLRFIRMIGRGGMGAVYEVEHIVTRHRRALKVLHDEHVQHPEAIERFLREATIAGRLDSPYVADVYDAGVLPDGRPYVLMEYLEGATLADYSHDLANRPDRVIRWLSQVCEAMEVAHARGIIHRDLKPENIFVIGKPGHERIKVLDFGVSKFIDAMGSFDGSKTRDGVVIGTPFYMSPEQALGSAVDARADVYAVGVMLYELLAGVRPYEGDSFAELVVRIHNGIHTPLGQVAPHLPGELVGVVERAMDKNRDTRFPDMRSLREALAPFINLASAERRETDPKRETAPTVQYGVAEGARTRPLVSSQEREREELLRSSPAPAVSTETGATSARWPLYVALGAVAALIAIVAWASTGEQRAAAPEDLEPSSVAASPLSPVTPPSSPAPAPVPPIEIAGSPTVPAEAEREAAEQAAASEDAIPAETQPSRGRPRTPRAREESSSPAPPTAPGRLGLGSVQRDNPYGP